MSEMKKEKTAKDYNGTGLFANISGFIILLLAISTYNVFGFEATVIALLVIIIWVLGIIRYNIGHEE